MEIKKNHYGIFLAILNSQSVIGSLTTPWTADVDRAHPWPEYPRPQMKRPDWLSLNGVWSYAIADIAETEVTYEGEIVVPYCVESLLSGVERPLAPDQYLWYKSVLDVPLEWEGMRVLLHFEAVDYEAVVFVNDELSGSHSGGYDAFTIDITEYLTGDDILTVRVWDPSDMEPIPVGKQKANNTGLESLIYYTPCSGIWQSVWLEPLPSDGYLGAVTINTDIDMGILELTGYIVVQKEEPLIDRFELSIALNESSINVEGSLESDVILHVRADIDMNEMELWSPDNPVLYDFVLRIGYLDQDFVIIVDEVSSYFGVRKIEKRFVDSFERFFLNNELLPFQIGPLDQGYWPDGIYSPPTEEGMVWDLHKTKELGFNMVRKHVKVECDRWYYWTDRLGLLVWQDFPAVSHHHNMEELPEAQAVFEDQWQHWIIQRYNHPSIVIWVVFNEAWGQHQTAEVTQKVMEKDPTRLTNPVSGWEDADDGHIRDHHIYPGPCIVDFACYPSIHGRITVVGELWGRRRFILGHNWFGDDWSSLGMTEEEFYQNYSHTLEQLQWTYVNHGYSAAVFTQTTDVEGELNGFFTYDRKKAKMSIETIRDMNLNFTQSLL